MVLEAKQIDELEMLRFEEEEDDFNPRSDSTAGMTGLEGLEDLEVKPSTIDSHLEKSLLQRIDNLKYGSPRQKHLKSLPYQYQFPPEAHCIYLIISFILNKHNVNPKAFDMSPRSMDA
ncbi:unnamed protein product [Mucor fragilis]